MAKFPMAFHASTKAVNGINSTWKSTSLNQPSLEMAIPVEFEGLGGGYSPEDLYLLALTNCFVATFKFAAEKSSLTFDDLQVESRLVVDLNSSNQAVMKEVHLNTVLKNPSNPDRAKRLLTKIEGSCLILNSVKSEIFFNHEIV